jgi:GDP-D-mannose dehydratase
LVEIALIAGVIEQDGGYLTELLRKSCEAYGRKLHNSQFNEERMDYLNQVPRAENGHFGTRVAG